jgi:hypothetical protein
MFLVQQKPHHRLILHSWWCPLICTESASAAWKVGKSFQFRNFLADEEMLLESSCILLGSLWTENDEKYTSLVINQQLLFGFSIYEKFTMKDSNNFG